MPNYYINKIARPTGEHEIHKEGCHYLNHILNKELLGEFKNGMEAAEKAKEIYKIVNGCYFCSHDFHKIKPKP
jgi:hypothetical protein